MGDWPKQNRQARYYTLPLTLQTKLELSGPFPLTDEEWDRFMVVLGAMEQGLRDGYQPEPEAEPEPALPKPAPPKKAPAPSGEAR